MRATDNDAAAAEQRRRARARLLGQLVHYRQQRMRLVRDLRMTLGDEQASGDARRLALRLLAYLDEPVRAGDGTAAARPTVPPPAEPI
jgi:hypothetical protein